MSTTKSISFYELLTLNKAETDRWQAWFERQPVSVLNVPTTIANADTIRGLLLHIFAVELRHTERLLGRTNITSYEDLRSDSIPSLFGIGERARGMLLQYLESETDEALREVIGIETRKGAFQTTKRRLAAHIFIHSIRHWAQLATALREAGFQTDWSHDVLAMLEFR
jgi:uncharacterized damage-inducible protein DinB